MRFIVGIAAIATALAIGTLLAAWEKSGAGLPNTAMQEGRASASGSSDANP